MKSKKIVDTKTGKTYDKAIYHPVLRAFCLFSIENNETYLTYIHEDYFDQYYMTYDQWLFKKDLEAILND